MRHRGRRRAQHPQRLAREPEHSAREHLEVARHALAGGVAGGRVDLAALRALVEQHRQDLVARDAVDDRVVDLRQQRDVTALEAVDQVQLPQRVAAVERPRVYAGDGLGYLAVVAGRRYIGLGVVSV